MKAVSDDHTVFVVRQAIREFGILLIGNTILDALMGHLHYPSLKSICDVFKLFNLKLILSQNEKSDKVYYGVLQVANP